MAFNAAALFADLPTEAEAAASAKAASLFADLPDAEEGSFPTEVVKGVVGGAVTAAGTALKGQAASQELALADRREMMLTAGRYFDRIDAGKEVKFEEIVDPDVFNYVNEYLGLDPERRAAMKEGIKAAAKIHPPAEDITKTPLYEAGEATQKFSERNFAAAEDYQKSITRTFTEGLGSFATMAGTSLVSRGLGIGTGIQMSVGEQVDEALRNGASPDDVINAANLAFFPGATEYAPMEFFFSKIPVGKWGKFADALVRVGTGFLVEGGQETAQQYLQNNIEKFVYNPDQSPYENLLQSFLVGGAVGGTVATATLPFTLGGERPAPPRPEGEPPPRYEPTPGAEPAETVLPPEPGALPEGIPPGGGPPGPGYTLTPAVVRPDSPRLTETDRTSPIPNDVIDDGKALVEVATGQPSTVTTTEVVDGKRQVVQTPVADLTAQNRAETQAVINQILQGVAPSPMALPGQQAAPPALAGEVAGTAAPTEAPAAVGASKRPPSTVTDYVVHTDDDADINVRMIRQQDGSAAMITDHGVIKHNAEFGQGKSDTDLLAWSFEPAGFTGATVVPAARDTALERATAPPAPLPIEDVSDEAHPRSEDTQSFAEFVAKSKAHLAEREARAEAIAEKGGSTRLEHQTREGHRALVGPDMAEPGKFRITRFDKAGPFGHTTFNTLKEAANEALRDGYVPVERPTAAEPPKQSELKAKVEANRGAAAPAQAPKPETRPIKDDVAITASGRDVPVTYAVIEADDLIASQRDEGGVNPAYPQELQPRDRSRGTSDQQINKIAQNLNPALLDQNPNASDGAPIISEEGVVESGNGRVLAIRRAFSQGLATAKGYVDYLTSQGYPVQGMRRPVLVRVRKGQLAGSDRAAFTREANERTTLAMSATERAMADAAALKPETVELYRGGDVAEAGNRDFVRSFMQQVVNPNEQAAMVTPEGGLSQEAIRRVQAALLARAYGDADLVGSLVESTDSNIKAIGGALMDVAGLWAQMRTEAQSEAIDPSMDATDAVLEAVRLVQRARNEGRPLSEFVAQKDIFSGSTISPDAEAVLRLMFRNTTSWTMPAGREKLAEALRFYATEARKTTAGVDLLGETAPPATAILAKAKERQYGAEEVQQKLPGADRATGKNAGAPSQERAVKAEPRAKAEGRPSPAPKAPAKPSKLKKKVSAKRAATAAAAARFPAEFNWKGSVGDFAYGYLTGSVGVRNDWQVRDKRTGEVVRRGLEHLNAAHNAAVQAREQAKAAATEEVEQPKFSRPGPDEPPPQRLSTKDKLLKKRIIKKVKTDPKAVAAMKAMKAVPDTSEEEGFNTDAWWDARRFNVGGKKVTLEQYLEHLYAVAKGLSTKEINDGIDQHNRELKEKEAKTGVKGTPLDHVEGYTVLNNRDVFIVQGPPAAGKSTIANVIARLFKAAISDIDEAKKGIPGYVAPDANGKMTPGIGASAVHTESGKIGTRVSDRLISEGANLVIPTVGDTHGKVEGLRDMLQKQGYKVHLVLMDIREDTAANRMWGRFEGTGRLIDPDYFMDVVFKPPHIFEYAKSKGKFDGYIKVKTDNYFAARVTEITGEIQGLALGDRFVAGGQIRQGRLVGLGSPIPRLTTIRPGAGRVARQQEVAAARAASFKLPAGVRQETATTPNEQITYTTTPAFAAKANAFFRSFRKILDGYGLKGVNLKVWEDILVNQGGAEFNVNGVYVHDLISLALQIGSKPVTSPEDALHHEVMHAMLELAATDSEKAILERKSKKEWITDEIKRSYPQAQWVEEGIAHAYVRWLQGERMDGMISRAFKNFKTFLKGLYQALTAHDIRTAEDVFRQVKSGKIGGRTQAGAGIEISPQASPATYFSQPVPSEVVDLFDGPAEQLVIPGAEKVSEKTLAQRRAEAPMRPTVGQKGVGELPLFGDEKNQLALFSKPLNEGTSTRERIETALNEAFATLFPNPLNNREIGFANEKQDAVIMMELENYGDSLYVKWLSAYPQKSGMGTQGMEYLKELATKHNVPLSLTTWDRGAIGAKKLAKIYEKWGFKSGKQGLMWWHPPTTENVAKFSKPPSGPLDPRFNLVQPPHTVTQSQAVMQGFIARGQPIDRAIRMPFSLFGGLDEQNRWRVTKRLDEPIRPTSLAARIVPKLGGKTVSTPASRQGAAIGGMIGAGISTAAGIGPIPGALAGGTIGGLILGSKAWPTNGAFGFFRGFVENAKRGLITDYGLDPAYIETFRDSDLYKAMKQREGAEYLKVIHNAGVGPQEAQVLQQILSGEPVNDEAMKRLAGPIRKAIDDMGAEAVSLGLVSAESFERNRGAYLHRVYAKNEVDQSTLAGWVSGMMASRRKKIIGDGMKGRGIFMDQPVERIMRDVESFQKGQRGAPVLGEKFRVIDEVSNITDIHSGKPSEKVMRRVYLPANEAVPAKYQGANWTDRGTWEVRKEGATTTLWRDYTKEERGKMGEIIDARYTIAKTFMLWANDLATGKFYQDIAVKEEWTQTKPPPDGTWKEGGEYNVTNGRYWEDPDIRWVKVPDTTIAKAGGRKKWGALAGKFVRSEIWRDLNELHLANNPGTWRILFRQWKSNHTFRLPGVHMNNIVSNLNFMDLADVRGQDLVAGLREYYNGGTHYQEAVANGAFGADTVSQELRDKVLKPILDEITAQTTGGTKNALLNWTGIPFLGKAKLVGIVADKLWTGAKFIDNGMMRAYQAEDEIFRMALYMRRRSQGESARMAAQNAREQFLNYDIRAPWVVALRNTLLPFVSYTYRAVPIIMHSIQLRPWKIAKLSALYFGVNALSYMIDDWGDDDEKKQRRDGETRERAALRDQEQGATWLGIPRMVRMPWRDKHGLPVFLDVRRWIPAGDVFDSTQGSSAMPLPAPLQFGGPLQLAAEFYLNKKAFDGKEITDELTQDASEQFTGVIDWAWKAWAPPAFWNPGSHYFTKILNAINGATDKAGRPYSVPQAVLSSFGIKVSPLDVENGIMWHFRHFKAVQTALKSDLRDAARRLERGLISQKAFDSEAANIYEKFGNLGQQAKELAERTKRPKREPAQ